MDDNTEKLIQAVSEYPELYNVTLQDYRNHEKRVDAWQSVGASTGLSAEECKTKWKSLRDRYIRERRLGKKRRNRGGYRAPGYWKHRETLTFLEPFIRERQSSDDPEGSEDLNDILNGVNCDTKSTESLKQAQAKTQVTSSQVPQLAFVTQLAPVQQVPQMTQLAFVTNLPSGSQISQASKAPSTQKQVRSKSGELPTSLPQSSSSPLSETPCKVKREAKDIGKRPESGMFERPHDEDELFLLSFVPALKRLTPQKRCAAKIKIQQIMYDAEFNDTGEAEMKTLPV